MNYVYVLLSMSFGIHVALAMWIYSLHTKIRGLYFGTECLRITLESHMGKIDLVEMTRQTKANLCNYGSRRMKKHFSDMLSDRDC